jgi:hypothetical protein
MPLYPSRFQWNETRRGLEVETEAGNGTEPALLDRNEGEFAIHVDGDRDDEITCRIEMDRLGLCADPHAVNNGRATVFELKRSDHIALLQLVEAGRPFGPLTERLRNEGETGIRGDIERSGRPIGRIRNFHHCRRTFCVQWQGDDGKRIPIAGVRRPQLARLIDGRHHISIRQHEDGPVATFRYLSVREDWHQHYCQGSKARTSFH